MCNPAPWKHHGCVERRQATMSRLYAAADWVRPSPPDKSPDHLSTCNPRPGMNEYPWTRDTLLTETLAWGLEIGRKDSAKRHKISPCSRRSWPRRTRSWPHWTRFHLCWHTWGMNYSGHHYHSEQRHKRAPCQTCMRRRRHRCKDHC